MMGYVWLPPCCVCRDVYRSRKKKRREIIPRPRRGDQRVKRSPRRAWESQGGLGKEGDMRRIGHLQPPYISPKMLFHTTHPPLPPSSLCRAATTPPPLAVSCRVQENADTAGGSPPRNLLKGKEGEGRLFDVEFGRGGGVGVMLPR